MSGGVRKRFATRAGCELFLALLYRSAPCGSLVEVRFRTRSGMGCRVHAAERLDGVAETVPALASGTDVYVGVAPRRRRGGGRADLVRTVDVVWVD